MYLEIFIPVYKCKLPQMPPGKIWEYGHKGNRAITILQDKSSVVLHVHFTLSWSWGSPLRLFCPWVVQKSVRNMLRLTRSWGSRRPALQVALGGALDRCRSHCSLSTHSTKLKRLEGILFSCPLQPCGFNLKTVCLHGVWIFVFHSLLKLIVKPDSLRLDGCLRLPLGHFSPAHFY